MTTKIMTLAMATVAFFAPVLAIILLVGLAILVDTIVALTVKQTKFSSKRLRTGVLGKMIAYQGAVLLFFLVDYVLINEAMLTVFSVKFTATKIVGLFLIGIEIASIDETIRGKYGEEKGFINQFKKFVGKIKKIKDSF